MKKTSKFLTLLLCIVMLVSCGEANVANSHNNSSNSIFSTDLSEVSSSSEAINYVTVKYDANGGKFDDGSEFKENEVEKGSLLTAPESPSREGFSFAGWSQSRNSSNLWKFGTDKINSSMTLYAVWDEEKAVILSVDGASIDSNSNEIFMVVDQNTDSVSLSNKVVCSSNSTWKLYYDKLGQTEIPTKIAAGMSGSLHSGENVFYVVVTSSDGNIVNVYTLTIYRSFIIDFTYYFKDRILKTENYPTGYETELKYKPSIAGYKFNYWMNKASNKVEKITPYENMSFYANATPNKYTITLDANKGEVSSDTKTVTYDSDYSLPVPQRTGYSFVGWYLNGTQITNDKGKSLSIWTIDGNRTVTAKWTANEYVLTLENSNSDAGTVSGGGSYAYDSTVTIKAVASNKGYSFSGWYNSIGTCVSTDSTYTFKMGQNETLTAKWNYTDVTLNYVIDGKVVYTETYTLEQNITELYQYQTNDNFYGWYKSKTFSSTDTRINSIEGLEIKDNNTYLYGIVLDTKFDFKYENSGYTITGYNDTKTEIDIPSSINGIPTKRIDNEAFKNCTSIISVNVPNSVIRIGKGAFVNCTSLEKITLPFVGESLNGTSNTHFGYIFGASYYNDNSTYVPSSLKEVIITGGTSIGGNAFSSCSSLTSIVIPNSVTSIGDSAFSGCSSLTIYCETSSKPSGWDSYWNGSNRPVYWGVTQEEIIYQDGLQFLIIDGNAVITGHTNELSNNVVIPETITVNGTNYNVTSIGYYAFRYCSSLTSIVIPNTVTSIGDSAFRGCSSLTSITIPNSVTSIGNYAFDGCSSLQYNEYENCLYFGNVENPYLVLVKAKDTSITEARISNNTKIIMRSAFEDCSSLTSITIPNSVTSIGDNAFSGCSSLTSVTFEDGSKLTSIGYGTFSGCSSLTSITIPNSVTSIGYYAFSGCSSLTSIVIPNSVTSIGDGAFSGCRSLTSIVIPNSVTSIGSYAFFDCSSLESITMPFVGESLNGTTNTHFGYIFGASSYSDNSTYVPSSLKEVIITGVTSIGSSAFMYCSYLTSIVIPNSVTSIGDDAFYGCSSLENVYYTGTIENWCKINFISYDSNPMNYANHFHMLNANNEYEEVTSIVIPDTITSIGNYQFYGFNNVTSITIPSSVTSIGRSAFDGCSSLTSITIPNSVTSIGWFTFSDCSSLQYNEYGNCLYLGNEENPYLVLVKAKDTSITEATISNNTKIIMSSAFYDCSSLTSITIPNSVTSIGLSAFYNCTSLTSITIPNSVTSIEPSAFLNCNSLTIYCETSSKPSGWSSYWNSSVRPVYWSGQWSYVNGVPTPNK